MIERKDDFDFCQDEEKLRDVLGQDFFGKLRSKKESLPFDLSLCTFENQCHVVSDVDGEKIIFASIWV